MFYPLIATIILWMMNNQYSVTFRNIWCIQVILSMLYTIFLVLWMIITPNCLKFYYWTGHLFPSVEISQLKITNHDSDQDSGDKDDNTKDHCYMFDLIQKIYCLRCDILYVQPIRKAMIKEKFGNDIGDTIACYLPQYQLKQLLDNLTNDWDARNTTLKA